MSKPFCPGATSQGPDQKACAARESPGKHVRRCRKKDCNRYTFSTGVPKNMTRGELPRTLPRKLAMADPLGSTQPQNTEACALVHFIFAHFMWTAFHTGGDRYDGHTWPPRTSGVRSLAFGRSDQTLPRERLPLQRFSAPPCTSYVAMSERGCRDELICRQASVSGGVILSGCFDLRCLFRSCSTTDWHAEARHQKAGPCIQNRSIPGLVPASVYRIEQLPEDLAHKC